MTEKEAIKAAANACGTSVAGIARLTGTAKTKWYERLKSKNMTIRMLKEFLGPIDYKVVIMPKSMRNPMNSFTIGDDE